MQGSLVARKVSELFWPKLTHRAATVVPRTQPLMSKTPSAAQLGSRIPHSAHITQICFSQMSTVQKLQAKLLADERGLLYNTGTYSICEELLDVTLC